MKQHTSWIIIGVVVVAILGGIFWYGAKPGKHDVFASCIAESGATFYGAFWCPHCQNQKSMFGKSANKLPYVECSTPDGRGQLPVCAEKKVETYPTWHFADGSVKTGTLSFSELSSITKCPVTEAN
jgi:hypothetical protein